MGTIRCCAYVRQPGGLQKENPFEDNALTNIYVDLDQAPPLVSDVFLCRLHFASSLQ